MECEASPSHWSQERARCQGGCTCARHLRPQHLLCFCFVFIPGTGTGTRPRAGRPSDADLAFVLSGFWNKCCFATPCVSGVVDDVGAWGSLSLVKLKGREGKPLLISRGREVVIPWATPAYTNRRVHLEKVGFRAGGGGRGKTHSTNISHIKTSGVAHARAHSSHFHAQRSVPCALTHSAHSRPQASTMKVWHRCAEPVAPSVLTSSCTCAITRPRTRTRTRAYAHTHANTHSRLRTRTSSCWPVRDAAQPADAHALRDAVQLLRAGAPGAHTALAPPPPAGTPDAVDDVGKSILGYKIIGSHNIKTSGMHMRTRIANVLI